MDNTFYRNILYNSSIGYAYHELIFDSKGVPCDYRFIEVNSAFELFTGLLAKDIIGKTVFEVMPNIVKDDFDWIAFYGEVALNNQSEKFESYSSALNSWYKVEVFSPKKNFFITIFSDISSVKKQTSEQFGDVDVHTYETLFNPLKNVDNNIIGVSVYARDISEKVRIAKALNNEKELAKEYLDIAAVMIIVLNEKGNITLINREGCNILGLDEKDIIDKNWFDNFLPKDVVKDVKQVFNNVFKKDIEIVKAYENTIITAQNEVKNISWHNSILYDSQKNPIGVLCSGVDVTEIRLAHEKIKENENRYRGLIESLDAGIVVHASDTKIISFNRRAEEMLGLSYNELSGKTASSNEFDFIDLNYKKLELEAYPVNIILQNKKPLRDYELGIKHIHGTDLIWVSTNGVPIFNDDSSIKEIVISFIDISHKKIKQDEIIHLSNHDYLTNLYNRRFFVERYKELDNEHFYPLGIMMVDVNGLKIINDAFGHDAGDIALQKVSEILHKSCRKQDIICRIGGDEFAIILPKVTVPELDEINETLRIESKNNDVESVMLSLATGYEIKTATVKGNLDEILKLAENQMYRHKLAEGISIRNNAIKAILKTLTHKYNSERIHSEKVSKLCKKMGEVLSLNEDDIKELELAGMYHDIGKISIPDAILNKPGRLTKEEFEIIKTHPEISYQILRAADEYSDLAIHALYHHERWDGKGYPIGKKGEEIPLFSRIICIVDAFEAMTSVRVYKNKMSVDSAVEELIRCAGTQFDERLTKVFIEKVLNKKWN